MTYRIMEYNILHQDWISSTKCNGLSLSTRSQNVVKEINTVAPDVILFAERHDEWAGIDTKATKSVDLVTLLGNRYAVAEDTIENGITNRTPIFYNTETFRLVDSGSTRLGEEVAFESSANKRVVSWAVLEDVTDTESRGIRILVFATHWSYGKGQDLTNTQSANMATVIKTVQATEDYGMLPVIAGGDFNIEYSNVAYQSLLATCSLADADYTVNGVAKMDVTGVDHISVNGCTAETFVIVSNDYVDLASDHAPIYCDVKYGG